MAQLSFPPQTQRNPRSTSVPAGGQQVREWLKNWRIQLVLALFVAEFLLPYLLWKAGLPRTSDWGREAIGAVIVLLTAATILIRDRIPGAILLIAGVTIIWGAVAMFNGQGVNATLWGWFRFFKYPLFAIFTYMTVRWPENFSRRLLILFVGMLAFQVMVQLLQFASGLPPGDSLAGTFAWKGVGQLSAFVFFVVCIGYGHWLATNQWKILVLTLALGLVASMLNVTKFYIPAMVIVGSAVMTFHMIRGGQIRQLLLYILFLVLAISIALPVFNSYVAATRGIKPLQEYLTLETIEGYNMADGKGAVDGNYNLGRGLSIIYAWQTLKQDYTTMLFGFGLGSRTRSTAFSIMGSSLEEDLYGGASGTGLMVMMQEFGLGGLLLFVAFNGWVIWKLFNHARRNPDLNLATLQYGLLVFTLFWPVWLWYQKPWVAGVMMTLYWGTLGYVFRQMVNHPIVTASRPVRRAEESSPVIPVHASANGATPRSIVMARSNNRHH